MKYDLTKHSLIEDNGDLVATFSPDFPASKCFKMLDYLQEENDINDALREIEETRLDLEEARNEIAELKRKLT
jgi:hypothetical protein